MPFVYAYDPDEDLLALLAAVRRDYADWLARHGQPARAQSQAAQAQATERDLEYRRGGGHDDGPPLDDFAYDDDEGAGRGASPD